MSTKKPGDETIKGSPSFANRSEDSFVGGVRTSEKDLKKVEAAPEVSQGAWRERVFTPRAIMSRAEIKGALESSLRVSLASASHPRSAFDELRKAWFPVLRQSLEQAGGDGIDVWLLKLFSPPGRAPKQGLFDVLGDALARMRTSVNLATFEEECLKLVGAIDQTLGNAPVKLSFKQMERQLEGKLEVDELLMIRGGVSDDLQHRLKEIDQAMGQLRDQIRKMPGRQPDGMYANFVRLKAELRVLDAELKARGLTAATPPPSAL